MHSRENYVIYQKRIHIQNEASADGYSWVFVATLRDFGSGCGKYQKILLAGLQIFL
jgi:hypothetical protein